MKITTLRSLGTLLVCAFAVSNAMAYDEISLTSVMTN